MRNNAMIAISTALPDLKHCCHARLRSGNLVAGHHSLQQIDIALCDADIKLRSRLQASIELLFDELMNSLATFERCR